VEKRLSGYGFQKRPDLGQNTSLKKKKTKNPENRLFPGQHSRGNIFPELGVGDVFLRFFEPLYLKNWWRYQNEHGSISSSSAPFYFFNFFFVSHGSGCVPDAIIEQ